MEGTAVSLYKDMLYTLYKNMLYTLYKDVMYKGIKTKESKTIQLLVLWGSVSRYVVMETTSSEPYLRL